MPPALHHSALLVTIFTIYIVKTTADHHTPIPNTIITYQCFIYFQACTFQKLRSNTALHVTYQGDTHVGLCGTCCKKWEFLFNGRPCLSPGPIDAVYDNLMLVNNNKPSVLPVFSHGSITGYCGNQPSGPVRVSMTIRICSDFPKDSVHVDTQVTITGRIIIQEVPPQQQWCSAEQMATT